MIIITWTSLNQCLDSKPMKQITARVWRGSAEKNQGASQDQSSPEKPKQTDEFKPARMLPFYSPLCTSATDMPGNVGVEEHEKRSTGCADLGG
jgi:hypothetical protein